MIVPFLDSWRGKSGFGSRNVIRRFSSLHARPIRRRIQVHAARTISKQASQGSVQASLAGSPIPDTSATAVAVAAAAASPRHHAPLYAASPLPAAALRTRRLSRPVTPARSVPVLDYVLISQVL
ncbi:hypothetical protein VPH35_066535 [Triticum aestivum]